MVRSNILSPFDFIIKVLVKLIRILSRGMTTLAAEHRIDWVRAG